MIYSEMSDFEINCAVAKALGYNRPGFLRAVLAGEESEGEKFDPCNSWADAGPIIHDKKINLYFSNNKNMAQFYQHGFESVQCEDFNPLRAAMIVFLMMKEADNAN